MEGKILKKSTQRFYFYLFISPWILGFLIFTLYPIIASFIYSFTNYNVVNKAAFIGLNNYKHMVNDPVFLVSIKATLYFTLLSVPTGLILSMFFALLLNQKVVGKGVFRTLMYMPSMVSGVAMSLLWLWIFNPQIGLLNYLLSLIHVNGPLWLISEKWAIPSLIIMSFWTVGSGMVIFLAAMQSRHKEGEEL